MTDSEGGENREFAKGGNLRLATGSWEIYLNTVLQKSFLGGLSAIFLQSQILMVDINFTVIDFDFCERSDVYLHTDTGSTLFVL